MGDFSQGQDHRPIGQALDFLREKPVALADFAANGFILRRQAFDRIGDATVDQFQSIVGVQGFRRPSGSARGDDPDCPNGRGSARSGSLDGMLDQMEGLRLSLVQSALNWDDFVF